ncbi:hypothetical protein MRB53_012008 [Persea americana]|uniref:Uncharacterized protein n=1 Tax=Persea americana TaxID=3435 RepID=A0ACC2LWK2_PERAE|nr:hypothetical protein MRB53_012008 [Persea americana]
MATTGKNFKRRLQGKREVGIEEIGMAKEDPDSASNQLDFAGNALTELQQELQIGRKQDAIDILQQRINQLSLEIKDKEISIENLNLSLAGKESECKDPTSIYYQTKEDLAQANSAVEGLKEEVRKIREELELKRSLEEDLTTRLKLPVTERDEISKKLHVLHEEYNDLMSDELVSVKEALAKTKQELLVMSEDLKKELLEVNKKAETTANDLKEEKRLVASLNKKVEELRKHTSKDKADRGKLERDLQEAAKSRGDEEESFDSVKRTRDG